MWVGDYLVFCRLMKELAEAVADYVDASDQCTLLKRLDEFNYALNTSGWATAGRTETDRR
jgi:hypothetical protein